MDALLARWRALDVRARHLALAGCVILAAVAVLPHHSGHPVRRMHIPRGAVATVIAVDPGAASTLSPGDRVTLVDPGAQSSDDARIVAVDVLVLSVTTDSSWGSRGSHVVVATDPNTALRLATTQGNRVLAVISMPP